MIPSRSAPHAPASHRPTVAARVVRPLPVVGMLVTALLGTPPPRGPGGDAAGRGRLSPGRIPDESAIVACLGANLPNLGAACRAVIDPLAAPLPRPGCRWNAAS